MQVTPTTQKPGQAAQGSLGMRRGSRVQATDGPAGQVDEILIEPTSGRITHFVLRQGGRLRTRQITVPASQIIYIKDNVVHLRLDKRSLQQLPDASMRGGI